ncbi:uncharacterized protein LOC133173816 [Saccostrea echinata]|uniref:uncharacterized protein LOC133173816 n=1 Tax=Saccostrea echinata TaxID=191078 RepID=UPI002A81215A|nr:uncharacterized protein LOC133173816 [Saccostrea echinata]
MRLDFTEVFGVCKSIATGVLLYPLLDFLECQEDDPSFWDSMAYLFGLEERIDKCKDTSDIVKALLIIIVIEIVWMVLVLLEPRKPLIKKPETRVRDMEEDNVINAIVTDAVRSAQQSFSS